MRLLLSSILVAVLFEACNPAKSSDTNNSTQQEPSIDPSQLIGSWTASFTDSIGTVTAVAIVTDGYFSVSRFDPDGKRFVYSLGGKWSLDGNALVESLEFHTLDAGEVGKTNRNEITLEGETLTFTGIDEKWTRLDDGAPGALQGAWLITGRQRNGQMTERTPGARKTMKILSGTRFQWIAYNTDSGQFFGTGGGTYTTEDGKYVENIDFFSRNADRVGASLQFDYSLEEGQWHHKGFSSKGDPMYEIWTLRSTLDKTK